MKSCVAEDHSLLSFLTSCRACPSSQMCVSVCLNVKVGRDPHHAVPGGLSLLEDPRMGSEPELLCTLVASSAVEACCTASKLRAILALLFEELQGRLLWWYGERRGPLLVFGATAMTWVAVAHVGHCICRTRQRHVGQSDADVSSGVQDLSCGQHPCRPVYSNSFEHSMLLTKFE